LHCYEVRSVNEKYRLIAREIDRSFREATPGHDYPKIGSRMVHHAKKVSNGVRADACDMSFALDYSLPVAPCNFYINTTIG